MTDPSEGLSITTQYALALTQRLQRFEMTDDQLREEFGLPADHPIRDVGELEINTELIDAIAAYLIDEEELAEEFDASEEARENILNIGMFIYGWEGSKHLND